MEPGDFGRDLERGVRGLRVAITTTLGYAPLVDAEIAALVSDAGKTFAALGAQVEGADPGIADPMADFVTLSRPGFTRALRGFTAEQLELVGPQLRDAAALGLKVSLMDYLAAQDRRRDLARKMAQFHERFDLLLTPTVAAPAFDATLWAPDAFDHLADKRAWIPFGYPFNMTGQPAISLPCGFTAAGLPVGLQIIGPRFGDARVLGAARAFETACAFADRRPPL